jgi:hypothetical protein
MHNAGAVIVRGYLEGPELTKQRFVVNRFDPHGRAKKKTSGPCVFRINSRDLALFSRSNLRTCKSPLLDLGTAVRARAATTPLATRVLADRQP